MSNLSVLPKILKLRSINQRFVSNILKLSSNCPSLYGEPIVSTVKHKNQSATNPFHKCLDLSQLGKPNCRTLYTDRQLWSSSATSDTTKTTADIDQFRANEVKVERDYEEQQRQKETNEENGSDGNRTRSEQTDDDHEKIHQVRHDILEASLQYVAKYGWSPEAIAHGAESINYPGVIHGMFPKGGIELINFFYTKCNRELIKQLQTELSSTVDEHGKAIEKSTPRDFAIRAIRLRLEMLMPYKDSWPQAIAMMTLPQNAPTSLAQLLTLVDDICYCAGDRSVDIGWYTRRIGIASIYKIVELYLLQDKSPNHKDTWEFLERRTDEAIQIQEFFLNSDQKTKSMAQALGSAFQTARNILGINCDKR